MPRRRLSFPLVGAVALVAAVVAAPPATTADESCGEPARRVLALVNAERTAARLPPLALSPPLCRVAQERAESAARRGNVDSGSEDVTRTTSRLWAVGYRPHAWQERLVQGPRDAESLVARWRADNTSWRDAVLGTHEDLGVGHVPSPRGDFWALVFALPQIRWQQERARPLADVAEVRAKVLAATNAARRKAGLQPFVPHPELDEVADGHARDMLERGYYAHDTPEGRTPRGRVAAAGIPVSRVGENLARGLFGPEEVVDRWMASSGHRRNILTSAYTHLGVGIAVGERDGEIQALWVQLFARPRDRR